MHFKDSGFKDKQTLNLWDLITLGKGNKYKNVNIILCQQDTRCSVL